MTHPIALRITKVLLLVLLATNAQAKAADWFEALKDNASPAELHRFLYAMPKGGDLHHHLTGAITRSGSTKLHWTKTSAVTVIW